MGFLSLPKGAAVLAFLSFISRPASAATSYVLDTTYSGSTFFEGWNFQASADLTHGFVQYISQSDAQTAGLISQGAGAPAYMGVDYETTLSTSGSGRKSVRITSQKSWTHGVFIADIAHMPDSTCGVWPAFWLFGPNWPNNGEIDIIEGVSRSTYNTMSLHTSADCVMTAGTQSGTVNNLNCDGNTNGNSGCNVDSTNGASYGTGFNNNGGGVYATEWSSSHIQTWFFPRGSVPSDITNGSPNPSGWGTPQSSFQGGSGCNIDTHFASQSLVFDTTFCGDWAGNVWGADSTCAALATTCTDYVAGNPFAFTNTYWEVNSVQVYQAGAASSSSSTILATTMRSSSPSSTTTSTTTITSPITKTSTTTISTSSSESSSSTKATTSSTKLVLTNSTTSSTSTKGPSTISISSSKTSLTTSTKPSATSSSKLVLTNSTTSFTLTKTPSSISNSSSKTLSTTSAKPSATSSTNLVSTKSTSLSTSTKSKTSLTISTKPSAISSTKPVPTKSTDSCTSTSALSTTSKSSSKTSSITSTKPSATPEGRWTSLGCYSDKVSARALPNFKALIGGGSTMTVELCQATCKASGYYIAGTEYAQECWCGNIFVNGGVRVGDDGTSGCNSKCMGNSADWCGGSNRLSAWKFSR